MGIPLKIYNDDVVGSYKQYILATMLAARGWKSQTKKHLVELCGTTIIDGKAYFGGETPIFSRRDETDPDDPDRKKAKKLMELIGLSEDDQKELDGIDWDDDKDVYIRTAFKLVHSHTALYSYLKNHVAPVASGHTVTLTYIHDPVRVRAGSTPPEGVLPMSFKRSVQDIHFASDPVYWSDYIHLPDMQSTITDQNVYKVIAMLYMFTNVLEDNGCSIDEAFELTSVEYSLQDQNTYRSTVGFDKYTYTTTLTITIHDASFLANETIVETQIFPSVDPEANEASTYINASRHMRYEGYTMLGDFWLIINDVVLVYYINEMAPYFGFDVTGLKRVGEIWYIEEEYWDSLDFVESMTLISQIIDIKIFVDNGFWDTFAGKFLGGIINLITGPQDAPTSFKILYKLAIAFIFYGIGEAFSEGAKQAAASTTLEKISTAVNIAAAVGSSFVSEPDQADIEKFEEDDSFDIEKEESDIYASYDDYVEQSYSIMDNPYDFDFYSG